MINPYEAYVPPPEDNIFTAWGKAEMLILKMSRFRERTRQAISPADTQLEFLKGNPVTLVDYDSVNLNRLVEFTHEYGEADLIVNQAEGVISDVLDPDGTIGIFFKLSLIPDEERRHITIVAQRLFASDN